jgi:hypothetical protein
MRANKQRDAKHNHLSVVGVVGGEDEDVEHEAMRIRDEKLRRLPTFKRGWCEVPLGKRNSM